MRVGLASVTIGLALVLGGCLGGNDSGLSGADAKRFGQGAPGQLKVPIQENWAELLFAYGDQHDHKNLTQHTGFTTPNFKILGHDPLTTDYHGAPSGGYFCSDTQAGAERTLSIVHSWTSDVALVISDVTDPTNPQKIGELALSNTHVYDVAISPDQHWAFLSTDTSGAGADAGKDPIPPIGELPLGTPPYQPGDITFRDACTGTVRNVDGPEQGIPFASGIVLVDISNPRNPAVESFMFFPPSGGHSIQTEILDGQMVGLVTQTTPPGYFVLMTLRDTPAATIMEIQSVYAFPAPVPALSALPVPIGVPGSTHDGFIQKHPATGRNLAYLGTAGSVVIMDISDLRNPVFVSRWNDWSEFGEGAPPNAFVHEALPIDHLVDGRHYTFIGEECGPRPNTPTCLVAMLDTTDPASPQFVGGWTLPIDVEWAGGYLYSLHYLGYANGTLYAAIYHGGLWAIDVSTPEAMRTMPSVGVFIPDVAPPKPVFTAAHQYNYSPVILDVNPLPDGTLVVYDGTTGLYVIDFDETNPAPPPTPWPFPFNQ